MRLTEWTGNLIQYKHPAETTAHPTDLVCTKFLLRSKRIKTRAESIVTRGVPHKARGAEARCLPRPARRVSVQPGLRVASTAGGRGQTAVL